MNLTVVKPERVDAKGAPWITDPSGRQITSHETAARTESILAGFERSGQCSFRPVSKLPSADVEAILAACHDEDYLLYLRTFRESGKDNSGVLDPRYTRPGKDPHTPLFTGAFEVALGGVRTALGAAHWLLEGTSPVYAACRPPGHHAGPRWPGGYCYLNNAMAATCLLLRAGVKSIAVIDLDFHFGDGSAAIAERWDSVTFSSLNASACAEYPWMDAEPTDPDQLLRSFLRPPSEEEYLRALDEILERCLRREVDALVISIGYDLIEGDPHGRWSMSPAIFAKVGEALGRLNLPLCLVQEGGYSVDQLNECSWHLAQGLVRRSDKATGEEVLT